MEVTILNPRLVDLSLTVNNWRDAVTLLSARLWREGKITALDTFLLSLFAREKMISTYCGHMIAIPHAVCAAVQSPALCIGRSAGMAWQTPDEYVRLIFLLAIPVSRPGAAHNSAQVDILSTVATLALDETNMQTWLNATNADEIVSSINHALASTLAHIEKKENDR